MRQDGQVFESIELSFDYLPGFSARQGYFYFQQDPSIGELHVFPLSYVELIGPYLSKLCDSLAASMIGDDRGWLDTTSGAYVASPENLEAI